VPQVGNRAYSTKSNHLSILMYSEKLSEVSIGTQLCMECPRSLAYTQGFEGDPGTMKMVHAK
jgi:hypothetical protein